MIEDVRPVTRQMLGEPDDLPLGPAQQLGEPPLAFEQRQVAQISPVVLQQVEGKQHRLRPPASAPQRIEVRHPVDADDHGLAVDQERLRLKASGGLAMEGKRSAQSLALRVKQRTREPSRRTIRR